MRQTIFRCDRCMCAFDPMDFSALRILFSVVSTEADGSMDLCPMCATALEAWVREPLEDDAHDAIDPTTGQPA